MWSRKCGQKNDVFFLSCLFVDLQLGLDGEGVVVRSCHDPSLMSKTKNLSLSLVFFLCVFLRVLVCLLPAINLDQR
jgi:hypothetical protein